MKAVVRPFEGTDLEGFDRLRTLLYPDRPETFDMDRYFSIWRWLGTHPLANQMQRWVVVTEEGEVVGHLAALPQFYRISHQRVVAHTPADYMVLRGYGFHAITLMRKFFRTCENCVTCDVAPAAIGVETGLGAEEVGRLQHAAKLQNVTGLPSMPTSIPVPITRPLNWGLRAVDRALMATIPLDHLRVEVLEGFGEMFDELFESVAAAVACVPEKDAAFLRWRYGPSSPQSPVTVLGVREGETLLGYAVLWVKVGGDTPRYASNLLDLMTHPGRNDVARALLKGAIEYFTQAGTYTIRYRFFESPTSPRAKDVWRLGFLPRSEPNRHTLLVKFADHNLHKAALDPTNWSYTTGDGEASIFF